MARNSLDHLVQKKPSGMGRTARAVWLIIAASVTATFFINLCALVYQCGCKSLWAGAAQSCNIHQPGSRHCPWCSIGDTGSLAVVGTMIAAQSIILFGFPRMGSVKRIVLTFAAFPIVGGILALVLGLRAGYWEFF